MSDKLRRFLLLSAFAFLAGCCASGPASHVPAISAPVSAHTVMGAPMEKALYKTVPAGVTETLIHSVVLNPDCTLRGFDTWRVLQPPQNGIVDIVKREGYSNFQRNNTHVECNKKKRPGMFVDYTPDEDFTGKDSLVVEAITLDGNDLILTFVITVK